MSKDNIQIWDSVKHVDEKYTKAAKVDGNKQTSIASLYPVYLMTKALGPIGELWRFQVVWEKFVDTKPVKLGSEFLLDNGSMVWEQDHTLFMRIETRESIGKEFTTACEQYGHTKYRYVTSGGYITVDHEYAKKSCSDALKKCLSLFGVCADVFMGDFDDARYREDVQDKIAIEKADETNEAEIEMFEEMKKELDDGIEAMTSVPNEHSINKIYALKARYFNTRLENKKFGRAAKTYLRKLEESKQKNLERLSQEKVA